MSREDQFNEIIRNTLAKLIITEIESANFLITINRVESSRDLKEAKIFVSVLPEKFSGTALKKLRSKSKVLSENLKSKSVINRNLRLIWLIDESLKKMIAIDETLDEIHEEEQV
jgi:ribosome-binding factor A